MSSQKRVFQVEVKAVRTRGGGKKFLVWEGLKGGHCGCNLKGNTEQDWVEEEIVATAGQTFQAI